MDQILFFHLSLLLEEEKVMLRVAAGVEVAILTPHLVQERRDKEVMGVLVELAVEEGAVAMVTMREVEEEHQQ